MFRTKRTLATLAALTVAGTAAGLAVVTPAQAASSAGGTITRSEVISRAQTWVNENVPYNQGAYWSDANGNYREDCSGYVSMAWHLTSSLVTSTLPNVSTQISFSSLKPGDALDYPSEHTFLFAGWTNKTTGAFTYYAESNPNDPTHGPTPANINNSSLEGWPTSSYVGLRYQNIQDDPTPPTAHHDFSSDNQDDIVAVNGVTGNLHLYEGDGSGGVSGGTVIGAGWNGMAQVAAGDVNGDGKGDIVGVSSSTGDLYLYLGKGNGDFQTPAVIGSGWGNMSHLALGDLNGDGKADVLAVNGVSGGLYYYRSTGSDVATGVEIGTGWGNMTQFAAGDLNGDGKADILAINGASNGLYYYKSTGSDVAAGVQIGTGWANFSQLTMADLNGDGKSDVVGVNTTNNALYDYRSTGSDVAAGVVIGTGWGNMSHVI